MLEIVKKGRFLKYVDVCFADTANCQVQQKCDVCTYQNIYELHNEKNEHTIGYTLISDLTADESELWAAIHKTTRYEIRRADRYQYEFSAYDSTKIANGSFSLDSLSEMYETMFREKGMPRSLDRSEILNIVASGGGLITAATMNGVPIVYHFYIYDTTHTHLTISCSGLWGQDEQEDKNLIGYANKWLHWRDFLYFKSLGIKSYDWGGVTWNEEDQGVLAGINRFKQSFGGTPVSYYSETVVMSAKAKIIRSLSAIAGRLKRP